MGSIHTGRCELRGTMWDSSGKGPRIRRSSLNPTNRACWCLQRANSPHELQAARALPEPLDLNEGWKISFGDNSKQTPMDHLHSWTEEETTKYFSGQATYVKTVSIPNGMLSPSLEFRLDFGEGTVVSRTAGGGNGMRAWMEGPCGKRRSFT